MESNERRLSFATRDTPVFVEMAVIGFHVAQLRRGEVLRIHEFSHTTGSGEENPASPYMRKSTEATVTALIERLKLPHATRRDGGDLLVIGR